MFSPTAIADFLACRHLTALGRAAAAGEIKKPMFADPGLELLIKLGFQHGEAYLRELTSAGLHILTIPTGTSADSAPRTVKAKLTSPANAGPTFSEVAEPTSSGNTVVSTTETKRTSWSEAALLTIEAMRAGTDVIYQAAFLSGQWYGRADFLRRVEKPSALGDWSYEVVETKLARSTKIEKRLRFDQEGPMVPYIVNHI